MAEEGRTVCVHGLPTDADHERLRDKLLIHFLRQSNGGGEVTSVTIIARTPLRALVTFEQNTVVQSVLRHHPHILQLDGTKYELSVSLPRQESQSLNKVIVDMTVTLDCSQLPRGAETLNVLRSEFPGLHMQRGLLLDTCTLQGNYSDFQGAFSYMQTFFNNHISKAEYPNFRGDRGQSLEKREDLASIKKWASFASRSSGDVSSTSMAGLLDEPLTECYTHTKKSKMGEGAECRTDEVNLEDLSIIMEADVFAYLQSMKEYNQILQVHGVQVVPVTSEGVTTLYLQSEVLTGSGVKQNMHQAHKELRQLYQQIEGCLRKDQIKKSILYMPNGLSYALKNVQLVLPNVLLSYDQDSIYIVGEKSDVSQAKQLLLLGSKENLVQNLTEMPASSSSSPSASFESLEREPQVKSKTLVHTPVPPKLIGSSTERKGEAGNTKEYKLAARFKGFGLGELGGDLKSLTTKTDMPMLDPTPPIRSYLGAAGVFSNEPTGEGTETFRITSPSCTGEDVLFKNQDISVNTFGGTTFNTSKARPGTAAGLTSTLNTGVKVSVNPSVNALLVSNTEVKTASSTSLLTSKSPLRRSNSFSGHLHPKDQVKNNQTTAKPMITAHTYQRARCNSLSGGKNNEDCQISTVEAELTVSAVMWRYMIEAYAKQLDAIKSGLKMTEKEAGESEMSVTLKGTDSSKVAESHRQLQHLVAMVASDFCYQSLTLTELGIAEKDKLFETCCLTVKSHFHKVILHTKRNSICLMGPKTLCSKASDIFKQVYLGQKSPSQMKNLQEGVDQGVAMSSLSKRSTKADDSKSDQTLKEFSFHNTSQVVKSNSSRKNEGLSTKLKSDTFENPRSTKVELNRTNSKSQFSYAREDATRHRNDGPTSLTLEAFKKQETSLTVKQTNQLSYLVSEQCMCGANNVNVKRTTCGVILCSDCLQLHKYCRVCEKEEMNSEKVALGDPVQSCSSKDAKQEYQAQEEPSEQEDGKEHEGIQGTMTCVEMAMSLEGYSKYTTAKITYYIPDGIQGDKDPSPGSPFKGGHFVAYLPLNQKGKSLLPCLEKAFNQGLTFTVRSMKKSGGDAKVTWGRIPHKTKMDGGKSGGYPDSAYLTHLCEALVALGIEGVPAISQDQTKS